MLPIAELLVILGCSTGNCNDVTAAYNAQNPEVMRYLKNTGDKAKIVATKYTHEYFVNAVIPAVGWAVKGEANVKVYRNIIVKIDRNDPPSIGFRYEF
jgi:hypothetical protein